jgi:hypothetical protein
MVTDRYKHENLKTGRKLIKFLLATLIVPYQLQVVLRSLLKGNGISGAEEVMILVVSQDDLRREFTNTSMRHTVMNCLWLIKINVPVIAPVSCRLV